MTRKLVEIAQHEAAHVVVGCALGLRLRSVLVGATWIEGLGETQGHALFDGRCGSIEAWLIMYAAGSVWEKRAGDPGYAWADVARMKGQSAAGIAALEHAAWCIVKHASAAHARVTRALCDARRITGEDLARIMRTGDFERD